MVSVARANYVRISARKVRYVLDLVRNKPVAVAVSLLERTPKRASVVVKKLILQAADSADKLHHVPVESLYVSKIFADVAGMMKRFRAMSMGRAGVIRKRLSHITVELDAKGGIAAAARPEGRSTGQSKETSKRDATVKTSKSMTAAKAKKPAKKLAGAK